MAKRLLIAGVLLLAACATAHDVSSTSWQGVAAELRAAGEVLEDRGFVEQPFWTRHAHVYSTSDAELQVYEFPSEEEAVAAAALVSPTGGSIGASSMSWMQPHHFFRRGSLIVIYLGSGVATLQRLENVLGPQFAGQ
jgi:hypothetical protein